MSMQQDGLRHLGLTEYKFLPNLRQPIEHPNARALQRHILLRLIAVVVFKVPRISEVDENTEAVCIFHNHTTVSQPYRSKIAVRMERHDIIIRFNTLNSIQPFAVFVDNRRDARISSGIKKISFSHRL